MAMPITTHPEQAELYAGDTEHWQHVMESLFEAAIRDAGFEPIRPVAQGSHLIHGSIIHHLSTADLVLVDLSSHNPNVFFELGVRTSVNLPIAIVRDEHTDVPFDTAGVNTHAYDSNLRGWEILDQQRRLAKHIRDSEASCAGQNPLWRQFGLTIKASEPDTNESPLEAKVDLLTSQFIRLQANIDSDRNERRRFEEERMMQTDRATHFRHPTYSSIRENESDIPPVEMFSAAIDRVLKTRDYKVHYESPSEAIVTFSGRPTPGEMASTHDLADRHGVKVGIRASGHDDSAPRTHTKRPRPTPERDGASGVIRVTRSDDS